MLEDGGACYNPMLRKLRQRDQEFEPSLGYIVSKFKTSLSYIVGLGLKYKTITQNLGWR